MSQQWKIVIATVAGTFMVVLDQTIVNIALPHIMAVFHETADKAQLVVSAYLMANAITTPAAAFLIKRFGIKRVYLLGQIGFLAGSILCGMSWDINSLITFRIIQGLSGGLLMPVAMTMLFASVPQEQRGMAMSIFGIPLMLAPAIGPTLGGYLVDSIDWRWCFYVNVPVVIVAVFIGYSWIKDTEKFPTSFDFKGFIMAAVGFSAVLYGLSYAPTWGWDDARTIALLSGGIICLIAWWITELRASAPLLDLRIFKYVGYSIATVVNLVTTIGMYSAIFLLPLFMQNLRGLSAFNTGLLMVPGAIGPMITMPISGRMYDKIGPRVPVLIGLVITGFTSLWLQELDVNTPDNMIRLMLFIRGMGLGFSMMPVMTYALSVIPAPMTAQASSLTTVTRTVVAALGTAIFATLLNDFQQKYLGMLTQTITPDTIEAMRILSTVQVLAAKSGIMLEAARQLGVYALYQVVYLKSFIMSFNTDYLLSALVIFVGIIPSLFLPHGPVKSGGGIKGMPVE
jgi:EmrB/QacA subfamily drug resistance transporter